MGELQMVQTGRVVNNSAVSCTDAPDSSGELQMVQRTASAPPAMPKGKPGSQSLMLAMADDGTVNDADDADEPYVEDLQTKLSNASDLAQPPTPRQAAAPRAAPSSPLAQPAPSAASAKSTREHVRFLELMSNSGAPHTAAGSPGFPALGQLRNVSPDRTGAPAASKWAPAIRHHVQAIHDRHQRLWQMVQELKGASHLQNHQSLAARESHVESCCKGDHSNLQNLLLQQSVAE